MDDVSLWGLMGAVLLWDELCKQSIDVWGRRKVKTGGGNLPGGEGGGAATVWMTVSVQVGLSLSDF